MKLLVFINRGRMGTYNDALALALATHTLPEYGAGAQALPRGRAAH